jgi:prepilin-type processing-associated H-X9-DG protein
MNRGPTRRRGFTTLTLLEVMVVISIILVLICLLLPAVNAAREAARRCSCVNNIMQLGIGLESYYVVHGVLPPGVVNDTDPIKNVASGYHFGWMTQILPYVDRRSLWNHLDYSVSVYDPANLTCRQMLISSFLCPSDPGPKRDIDGSAMTNYAACHNDRESPIGSKNNGVFFLNSAIRPDDILDGSAYTIFVGEKRILGAELGWASGTRATLRNTGGFAVAGTGGVPLAGSVIDADEGPREGEPPDPVGAFSSSHPGGMNFCFGDGSVRFVKSSISARVFRCMANRADGEIFDGGMY